MKGQSSVNAEGITFELIPHKGLSDILFGMDRKNVRATMKNTYGVDTATDIKSPKDFYFGSSLQFNYKGKTLSFIEIAIGHPLPFQLKLFGTFIHKMAGKKLQALIEEHDTVDDRLSLDDNLYFKENYITLWRSHKKAKWDALGLGDRRFYEHYLSMSNDV